MVQIASLIADENRRWNGCIIHPGLQANFNAVAARLVSPAPKAIYKNIEKTTGVPWFIIAVIHEREASQQFRCSIAQGDPWDKVSTHVPAGRGPFASFEDAALDALVNCNPKAAKWTDWSPGGALTILEEYNGLGYAMKGLPSPYIWAGTNQYIKGKYTADGHFDPEKVDTQLGCAGLLRAMMAKDPSIKFGAVPAGTTRIGPAKTVPVVPSPSAVPSISHPAAGSLGDAVAIVLRGLFSHLHF